MADQSYSYLAPFGGITRIRFKGFVQDVSANLAPPQSCHEHKKTTREVNAAHTARTRLRALHAKALQKTGVAYFGAAGGASAFISL